ncbi:hypothetical protein JVU11DRAFT_2761 [Chiua virens]|nr:hypothetical protein JVU11DRAFT_2761 [Chiua virens]
MTPAMSPTPAPLVQDGSYLEALGQRLNEAVSKALAQPSGPALPNELVGGRRPIPTGRGRALGALITSELQAARNNSQLYRAVLRALHKPLSVLLSNLSALLLPLLSSPAFVQSSAPTPQAAFQLDDMAIGTDIDNRWDGLKSVRAGLISLIDRVTAPLITGIKEELLPLVDALENPAKPRKVNDTAHPSITAIRTHAPLYGRALTRYASTNPSQALLASLLISIIWRALVALSHRPIAAQTSPQTLPADKGPYTPSTGTQSGAFSPKYFSLKRSSSRPPSPIITSTAATDAKAFYEILSHFPRPHSQVAHEAVDEAIVHMEALVTLLEIADDPFFGANKTAGEIATEIQVLTDDLPMLIALPVLLRMRYFGSILDSGLGTVAALLNIPEEVYRKDCLTGFGRADQCGPIVGQRLLDEIYTGPVTDPSECLVDWLEAHLGQDEH